MALNFPSSPVQGSTYAGSNGLSYVFDGVKWNTVSESSVPEAPIDGTQYGREDGAWTAIAGGSSGVTGLTAGTGISLSGSTGNVTVTNSSPFDNTGDLTVGGDLFIGGNGDYGVTTSSSSIFLKAGSKNCQLTSAGSFITPGEFRPISTNAFNLGAGNFRWSTIYSNDLSLSGKATSASTSSGDGGTTLATKDYVDATGVTPGNATITIVQPGTTNQTFTVNQSGNQTITLKNDNTQTIGTLQQVTNAGNSTNKGASFGGQVSADSFTTSGSINSGSITSSGGQTFGGGIAANGFITCNSRVQAGAHSASNVAFQYTGKANCGMGFPSNEDVALFAGGNKLFALKSNGTAYLGRQVDDSMVPGQDNDKNGVLLKSNGQLVCKRNSTNNSSGSAYFGGNTGLLEIKNDGDLVNTNGRYEQASDVRLKENVVDASSSWEDIKAFRWVNYNFKPETNLPQHTQLGLIAQEVEAISPGLVSENEITDINVPWNNEVRSDFSETYKSVAYSIVTMKSAVALKEAILRIEELERRLNAIDS
tara:strand:+ start:149 stop:1753 length:1605 start_codon:yes stop_codon:yes gene_type:complete